MFCPGDHVLLREKSGRRWHGVVTEIRVLGLVRVRFFGLPRRNRTRTINSVHLIHRTAIDELAELVA